MKRELANFKNIFTKSDSLIFLMRERSDYTRSQFSN